MVVSNSTDVLTIENDQRHQIMRMLLIGLDAYGEIERLENAVKILEICKTDVPETLRPIHPTGSADTISEFATALRFLHV